MSANVGAHDGCAMQAPGLGHWVECECSWIGPSMFTEDRAIEVHRKHAEASK